MRRITSTPASLYWVYVVCRDKTRRIRSGEDDREFCRERETGTADVNGRRYDMNVWVACNTLYTQVRMILKDKGGRRYIFDRRFL